MSAPAATMLKTMYNAMQIRDKLQAIYTKHSASCNIEAFMKATIAEDLSALSFLSEHTSIIKDLLALNFLAPNNSEELQGSEQKSDNGLTVALQSLVPHPDSETKQAIIKLLVSKGAILGKITATKSDANFSNPGRDRAMMRELQTICNNANHDNRTFEIILHLTQGSFGKEHTFLLNNLVSSNIANQLTETLQQIKNALDVFLEVGQSLEDWEEDHTVRIQLKLENTYKLNSLTEFENLITVIKDQVQQAQEKPNSPRVK